PDLLYQYSSRQRVERGVCQSSALCASTQGPPRPPQRFRHWIASFRQGESRTTAGRSPAAVPVFPAGTRALRLHAQWFPLWSVSPAAREGARPRTRLARRGARSLYAAPHRDPGFLLPDGIDGSISTSPLTYK